MPVIDHQTLRRITQSVLEAVGTPPASTQAVCESLIEANLMGHDSHGILRLPQYIELVRNNRVRPQAAAYVVSQQGATAQVDGAFGWGQPAARLATQTVIGLAAEHGLGAVTIINCNHIGRVGEYVEMITRAGMIGIALCNAGPAVAPYGSYQRIMGTNPFALAAPGGPDQPAFVLDFATAAVAEGKLRVARSKGELLHDGLIVDAQGQPSIDPADFYAGGALQTFGLHKGSGLSVLIELLARGLCGVDQARTATIGLNGPLIMALNIAFLAPTEQFASAAERLRGQISSSPPVAGFDEVLVPGDPERRMRQLRLEHGIPLPEQIWSAIETLAAEWNVPV